MQELETELSLEEHDMLIMDAVEPSQPIIVVAQAQTAQAAKVKREYAMGVCMGVYPFESDRDTYERGENDLSPEIILYFRGDVEKFWGIKDNPERVKSENIQVIRQPKHGALQYRAFPDDSKPGKDYGSYIYTPEKGYVGNDKIIFKLDVNGKEFKVVYILKVISPNISVFNDDPDAYACKVKTWKISSTSPDGTSVFSSDDAGIVTTGDYALSSAVFAGYNYLPPQVTFRDLTGAAIGETIGEGASATITLDTDAAGHGWYTGGMFGLGGLNLDADFTQGMLDMSNWLPTSSPNEWVAKAGTEAAGKMDMLSVLLHEYGHALGIEHSHDAHNYMATTLTPGMRRLPSASDMQLMAQLAAEAREAIMAGQEYVLNLAQFGEHDHDRNGHTHGGDRFCSVG